MRRRHLNLPLLLSACLLQACSPVQLAPPLAVEPLLRIDDSRHALRKPPAAPATPTASTAPTAPAASAPQPASSQTAATLPLTPPRMEIVQLGPNQLRLQYRQAEPPRTAAAGPMPAAQIQIVNGNGVRGMGERVRRLLARHGLEQARVVNQRGHYQRTTIIEYLPGQQARADAMLAALQGHATLLPASVLPAGLTVRLVLGRDNASRLAALEAAPLALPVLQLRLAQERMAVPHFNQE